MRSALRCAPLQALVLSSVFGGACVQDVWLGPEPLRDAGEPVERDSGEPDDQVLQDGGGMDEDAGGPADASETRDAASEPEDAASDAGDELDAGPAKLTFCGLADCDALGAIPCQPDYACWLTEQGDCATLCNPAPVCGIGDTKCDDPDTYCNFVDRQCNTTGRGGYCTPRPKSCDVPPFAVCDCLGRRHESECAAASIGMPIRPGARCD